MGSSFDYAIIDKPLTPDQLRRWWTKYKKELEHEHGYGPYSGTLKEKEGLYFPSLSKQFYSRDEATDWIANQNQKWDSADAVRVQKTRKTPQSLLNKKKRYEEAYRKLLVMQNKKYKSGKKEGRKKCNNCESLINLKYAKHMSNCPVCNKLGWAMTKTQETSMKQLNIRVKKAKANIAAMDKTIEKHKKNHPIKGFYWIVGGYCSS